jgi:hypothetical protein
MTSHTGTEDYPWEWYLTDEGEAEMVPQPNSKRKPKTLGTEDTLRSVKDSVRDLLGG